MFSTPDTSQSEMSPLNDSASRNMSFILATLDTSHFERSPLNDAALQNMPCMSFTRDTSHFEMSPLNDVAPTNRWLISVTRDTSHSPIGPCGLSEPSPSGECSRYASTVLLSSALDCGENTDKAVLIVQTVDDIDPDVPSNI